MEIIKKSENTWIIEDDGVYKDILNDDLKIYKGAIYENIVSDAFSKMGKKLYYFKRDSGLEIDFVSKVDDTLSLIEVKAKSSKSKSLRTVLGNKQKYNIDIAYKLGDYDVTANNNIISIPHYMAFLLK